MSFDHLWAGWRASYLASVADGSGQPPVQPATGGSLFERLLAMPDAEAFVVHRGPRCATLLNAYPYTNGHLLVLPARAVPDIADLDPDELVSLGAEVRDAVVAVRSAYRCDGVNVGMNLGRAAGAGVPEHLHWHVLPRWDGDTNFMTAVATTRVMPEPLDVSWAKVRDAWPR